MGQVMVPGGGYRLHEGVMDMDRQRFIAQAFANRTLAGLGEDRVSRVLPLVRGDRGWFYLPQPRRGFGAMEPQYENCIPTDTACVTRNQQRGIAYQESLATEQASTLKGNCVANANLSPEPWRSQQLEECDRRWPEGWSGNVPAMAAPLPEARRIDQTIASAITQKANQSVPPQSALTPMPTGTGASGGNPLLSPAGELHVPPAGLSTTQLLLIGGAALALVYFMGRRS